MTDPVSDSSSGPLPDSSSGPKTDPVTDPLIGDFRLVNRAARRLGPKLDELPRGPFRRLLREQFREGRETGYRAGYAKGLQAGYSKSALNMLRQFLRPDDLVLDCGANVGEITGFLAPTGARVHSFEPDPLCFAELDRKFGDTDNVTLHNVAVSVAEGEAQFYRHRKFENIQAFSGATTMVQSCVGVDYGKPAFRAPVIDLLQFINDLLAKHGEIAVLKLDVEGAEVDIAEEMLKQDLFSRIRTTLIETHEKWYPDLVERTAILKARLADRYPEHQVCTEWF